MFTTADLWDEHGELLNCVSPIFRSFGNKKAFSGEITTLKLFEDNSLVRKQLESDGKGKVLVIDGGASLRCALIGDQLAALALQNNWNGILVNGCIRDSHIIDTLPFGIKALNTSPVKSSKHDIGDLDVPINFGGVTFISSHYIYADMYGIIESNSNLFS
jgi:regulator of ribonuclease activity A